MDTSIARRPEIIDLPDDFELDALERALEYVKSFRTAVDAGAHKGAWAAHMAKRFLEVWAFEPQRDNFLKLSEKVKRCVNIALGDVSGMVRLAAGKENTGQYHVSYEGGAEVRMLPLDQYGLENVDFLKADVEGYELKVLQGAARTLHRCRPVVMCEENGLGARYGVEEGRIGEFLAQRGYRLEAKIRNDRVYVPC